MVYIFQIVVFVYKTIHPMHLRVFIHVEQGLCQNDAKATNSLHFIRTVAPVYEIAHSLGFFVLPGSVVIGAQAVMIRHVSSSRVISQRILL